MLSQAPVVQPPDWTKSFHVFVDASNIAIGSVLMQLTELKWYRPRPSEKESEKIQLATLCELEEHRIAILLQLELELRRRKAFVDRHRRGNEKEFEIGKLVQCSRPGWET